MKDKSKKHNVIVNKSHVITRPVVMRLQKYAPLVLSKRFDEIGITYIACGIVNYILHVVW